MDDGRTTDRQRVITIAHSEHFALRWAKNQDISLLVYDTSNDSAKQNRQDSLPKQFVRIPSMIAAVYVISMTQGYYWIKKKGKEL